MYLGKFFPLDLQFGSVDQTLTDFTGRCKIYLSNQQREANIMIMRAMEWISVRIGNHILCLVFLFFVWVHFGWFSLFFICDFLYVPLTLLARFGLSWRLVLRPVTRNIRQFLIFLESLLNMLVQFRARLHITANIEHFPPILSYF